MRNQPLLGRPWPTLVMRVGNSHGATELMALRDVVLGPQTQINVFVGVAYNRNTTRERDSWWICVGCRNVMAPPPPPNAPDTYPPYLIVETPPVNGHYPLVEDPVENPIWTIPTDLCTGRSRFPFCNHPSPQHFNSISEQFDSPSSRGGPHKLGIMAHAAGCFLF